MLRRATCDGLTGLPNHRAFQDELPLAGAAAVCNQEALALVALDVDDFKLINDRYGHPRGDAALSRVAEVVHDLSNARDHLRTRRRARTILLCWPGADLWARGVGSPAGAGLPG